ncbi:MAG TPA: alanine racemase [Candidatus Angelobacter sp.]|nr:alanine racemase [Candidatus Angelobacter sp.]
MTEAAHNPPATSASPTAQSPVARATEARPCWVEVSLTALRHNFRTLHSFVRPEAIVCSVIKSDAYGHGAIRCALALQQEGALWFAVNTAEEGAALRAAGIRGRILLLAGVWRGEEEEIVRHDLTPAVWEWQHLELLENAAERLKSTRRIAVHVKVNTGMNRLGVDLPDLPQLCEGLRSAPHILLEGIFSHFAASEVYDQPFSDDQVQRFQEAIALAQKAGLNPMLRHMANSAAVVTRPQSWFNMVRPGLALYGYFLPFTSVISRQPDISRDLPVQPALSWKTRVLQVRDVAAGQQVGYSAGYVAQAAIRVAVLPVGYGDGLNRHLSNRGRVIVRNDYAAIIGNISMNLTTIDVTGIAGVQVGDEVTIIGESASRKITAWEHASVASTIPYDILCNVSSRLPRKYTE